MQADLEHQARELFQRAAALPGAQRAEFLRAHCSDQQLALRVEQLLRHDDIVGSGFLRGAAVAEPAQFESAAHPQQIGRFRILSVLGHGGMGTVYEAEQDKPHRKVALKVIRPGWMSRAMLRRFEYEAEMLARLDHPGIARVYDAGTADSGHGPQPYFAMELVHGQRLDAYIRDKNPPTKQRLELLIDICQAVHHAHTKGVIHRDLKPANILITNEGKPKILDFGVARATDSDIQSTTLHTESGQILGTLPYMAPEQAAGRAHELDTSSDVYALGVIAYELLSGQMPYALEGKALHEAVRVICEDEPSRLSSINKSLRGDVETIVGKALEKDRTRRYHTAGELAADVKRYLDYEPITARPPGTWYQLSRFTRRNKLVVASVGLVLLAFAGASVISTWQAIRATRARNEAERSQKQAESVLRFVTNALQSSDPMSGGKQDTTILQAMDNAIRQIQSKAFEDDPQTDASLGFTIARILVNNGRADQAEPLAEQALEKRQRLYESDHPDVAQGLDDLAYVRRALGRAEGAELMSRQSLEMRQRLFKGDHPSVASSLNNLASILQDFGRPERAEPLFQQSLEMRQRLFKGDDPNIALCLNNLGLARKDLGRPQQAEPLLQQALEMQQRLYKGDHPNVAMSLHNLAEVRVALGRPEQGEALYQQALEVYQRMYKGDHPAVASCLNGLGLARRALGRLAEAEAVYQQALEMRQRLYKGDHPLVAWSMNFLAQVRKDLGGPEQAESLCQQALEMQQRLYQRDHPDVAHSLSGLASVRRALGRTAEAEPLYQQALEMYQRLYEGDHRKVASSLFALGLVRKALGHPEQAEPLLQQALEMSQRLYRGDHADVAFYLTNLAAVRRELGRSAEAAPLYQQALEMHQRLHKGDHQRVASSMNMLALTMTDLGRPEEAEPLGHQALEMYQRLHKGDHPNVASSLNTVGLARKALGRPEQAEPLCQQAVEMYQRLYKGDHPDVARSLYNLALVRRDLRRPEQAELLCRQAQEMRRRLFKGDHPEVARSLNGLALVLLDVGRADEAEQQAREAVAMAVRIPTLGPEHPHTAKYAATHAKCLDSLNRRDEATAVRSRFGLPEPTTVPTAA